MDFFKRLGTDRHKFKLEFYLDTLSCNTRSLKGDVYVTIKRGIKKDNIGDHKISTDKKFSFGEDGVCEFGRQILTFQSTTLFFDSEEKAYQEKTGQFKIVIIGKSGEKKLLGTFQFDVAQWANSGKQNIHVKKQFGQRVKSILEFEVFLKCMGQASQTSKSVDKPIKQKKQSSLTKFTSFFTGSKQSPENKNQKEDSQNSNKRIPINKNTSKNKSQRVSAIQASDVFKNKYDASKKNTNNKSQTSAKNIKIGSDSNVQPQQNKKKKDREYDQEQTPPKNTGSKNLVDIRKKDKDNYTELEDSQADAKVFKKTSTPQQQPFFFDDFQNQKSGAVETNISSSDQKPQKIKRTQQAKQQKIEKVQIKESENEKIISQLKISKGQLQKQNKSLQSENKKILKENKDIKEKLQSLNQKYEQLSQSKQQDRNMFQTERQNQNQRSDDERVRMLQKQKGDLLVKIQKLEQKYKKDFKKYEEQLEMYESQRNENEEMSKGQLKRIKEQSSDLKDKYDKLLEKLQEKTNQAKELKQKQNDLKQRLAIAQNNLSQVKLKIGDKLNEANEDGDKSIIDILTYLSE